jgi:hypothetical protein
VDSNSFPLCKASPGAYIVPIELNIESCLYYLACDVFYTICRVLYDDDRLHVSTLLNNILVVDVLLLYD